MEYITRGVCGQEGCRERRYYLDNGRWFCRRGHLQEGVQVEEDPEDFGTQGKTHRVKKTATEKSKKTYRGRQAYTLFLQIYQLILWKQCHALISNQGFPAQFEVVVRDLWALRLQDFSLKINESAEDDDDDERELFSSQPTEKEETHRIGLKITGKYLQWPRLVDSIGLCYLAALLMRLPICVSDFHRMVIRQDVPYLRVTTAIPREMRDKLSPEFLALLEVNKLPEPGQFQKPILQLAMFYQRRFEITFPPLNAPLIIYRQIKRLAIPVEVYATVKELQDLVGFTYGYPGQAKGRRWRLCLPEAHIMALIVIGTKLLFPFDDVKRYPATDKEPAAQTMNWDVWAQAQRHFDHHERSDDKIGRSNVIHLTDQDVLNMTPRQLDEYMDWYADSWLDTPRVVNHVAGMFPTSRAPGENQPDPDVASAPAADPDQALGSVLHAVMQDMRPRRIIPEADQNVPRPGSFYRRYRTESTLTGPVRAFYELAAQLAGVSLRTLVRVVSSTESKLSRLLEDQRRAEYFGKEVEIDSADAMDDLDEELSDLDMNGEA